MKCVRGLGGLEGWQVVFSNRISIWWTVSGDWRSWRGGRCFVLVGCRSGGLIYLLCSGKDGLARTPSGTRIVPPKTDPDIDNMRVYKISTKVTYNKSIDNIFLMYAYRL